MILYALFNLLSILPSPPANIDPATGIIGTAVLIFGAVATFLLNSTREAKKSYKEQKQELKDFAQSLRDETKEHYSDQKNEFAAQKEDLREHYHKMLDESTNNLKLVITIKEQQIAEQKNLYEEMIETRTKTIWEPLESKLIKAEEDARKAATRADEQSQRSEAQSERLMGIIQNLREELDEKREMVSNLTRYEHRFSAALEYINKVIEALAANNIEVPVMPQALKYFVGEDRAFVIPMHDGQHASIKRSGDDIVIGEFEGDGKEEVK